MRIAYSKWRMANGKSGFTLIELLLYMALFAVLLVVLLQLFTGILDVQVESQATSVVSQDARYLLARFSYDIEQSSSIVAPPPGGQSGTLQIVVGAVNYTYSVNNGNLMLTTPSGTDALNSSDTTVSNLTFSRTGNNLVTISFTLIGKAIIRSGQQTETFQTTVAERKN